MENGYTLTYCRWDDCKECVCGRFKTKEEKDEFLRKLHDDSSGWTSDELESICVIEDYNYILTS